MLVTLLAALGLIAEIVAAAPPPAALPVAPAPASSTAAAAKDKDDVICHQETPLGSHISRKVCVRRSEAVARDVQGRRSADELQRQLLSPR
jgi:hypothetical protein